MIVQDIFKFPVLRDFKQGGILPKANKKREESTPSGREKPVCNSKGTMGSALSVVFVTTSSTGSFDLTYLRVNNMY